MVSWCGDKVFRGEATHSVDSKFRIIIPVKFREQLGERFVITRGLDDCLFAYPMEAWAEFEAKVNSLPMSDPDVRRFVRAFVGGAFDAELDAQGRSVLPLHLREHAGIGKEVVFVGALDKLEIWDSGKHKGECANPEGFKKAADTLVRFGI